MLALVALAFGPAGLVRPGTIRPLFQASIAISRPIGWVVSHVMMALLFYGVFTPMALFFRLIGRDPLGLRRRPEESTYWRPKPSAKDSASYLRQA